MSDSIWTRGFGSWSCLVLLVAFTVAAPPIGVAFGIAWAITATFRAARRSAETADRLAALERQTRR